MCGAEVTAVGSAREALREVERLRPDVLVSDLGMPGEDGYWLIREVRALPTDRGGKTPAAVLTAYVGAKDQQRTMRAGFQNHVPKPVEPQELVAVVANLAGHTG
jgi:CheY-like chemotaxis protein